MILFQQSEHVCIPSDLLRAARDFDGFASVHLEYWTRHGGLEGLCTYQDAFEYLVSDLEDHGLPVKYSSFRSFKSMKTKMR